MCCFLNVLIFIKIMKTFRFWNHYLIYINTYAYFLALTLREFSQTAHQHMNLLAWLPARHQQVFFRACKDRNFSKPASPKVKPWLHKKPPVAHQNRETSVNRGYKITSYLQGVCIQKAAVFSPLYGYVFCFPAKGR